MTEVFYFQCYMAITVAFRDGGWCMSVFLPFECRIRCFRIILHQRFTILLLFEHELPLIAINFCRGDALSLTQIAINCH